MERVRTGRRIGRAARQQFAGSAHLGLVDHNLGGLLLLSVSHGVQVSAWPLSSGEAESDNIRKILEVIVEAVFGRSRGLQRFPSQRRGKSKWITV